MSSSPTQVAGSAAPRITNDEVRAVLHTHIRKTAKFIKFLDLCVYMFAWVAVMFGLWLLACIVDHWLVPLSSFGRWVFWGSAVAGTTWWLVTKLIPLLFLRINPAYAAKRIEHLLPEFKNGLISWLELDQMPESGVPRGIMSALTYRAARFIGGQDPSTTVDTSRLIKLVGVVLLLFTSLVVYTMVSPKSVLDTGKRIAMPWRSIAAPSRVQILSVKPGAIELTQGKPLEVDVEVRGIRTNEAVRVRFTTTDGQLRDQRVELTAVSEGYHYSGKVRTETSGVEHELDYWVEAGDAVSGPYRVSLSPLPSVILDQVELKFPAYTKIADRKVSGGDFEAVEGTRATIHAVANQKMARGRWEVNPEIDAAGELLRAESVHELSVDDRNLTGTLLLQLNSEKENPTKLTYRLRGFNQRGDGNREPIVHAMKVIADVAPEIKLVGPESRRQKVRPTSRFNLEVQANDPDFGLSQIDIEIRHSGLVVRKETLLKSEGAIGQQIKRLAINMADFKLAEGRTLEVRAIAHDNRHDPVSERLAPNSKESEPLILEVVGPDQEATPDEEPTPSDEQTAGNGKSEKNQDSDAASSRSNSQAGNSNAGSSGNSESKPNDANGSEPSQNNSPNQNGDSQEPRQNQSPNPTADPNGGREQGEQPGKQDGGQGKQEGKQGKQQGKQEGKPADDSKPSEGKQKPGPGQTGGQGGTGAQDAGKQEQPEQGSQSGSKSDGTESSEGGKQPDTGASSSGKNSSGKNNKSNSSGGGQSGNEPSNSAGSNSPASQSPSSKPNSPNSNASKAEAGSKSNSDNRGEQGSNANDGRGEGSKPSDGEVVKRVQEYMQDKDPTAKPEQDATQKDGKQNADEQKAADSTGPKNDGAGSDGAKSDGSNNSKGDGEKSKGDKADSSNVLGQPNPQSSQAESKTQPDPKANPSDSTGKQKPQAESQVANDKGSNGKSSEGKENSESKVDKSSDSKNADGKNASDQGSEEKGQGGKNSEDKNSDGKGSDSKNSDGKNSDGKGSDGKGSDGKGADGKGSDGKGADGKGADGKGSDGKGADGKGADGKGADGKGADGKGADGKGADGKGADGKGSDGKGADGKGADGKGAEGKGADGKGADGKGADGKGADGKGSDGKGAEGSDAKSADSKNESSESSSKGSEGGSSQPGKPSGSAAGGGKANGSKAGKSGSSGSGTGNGEGGGEGKPDEANKDYASRTTQMVLDYLNRQKDQPDPELLRELNWTEDDLRRFTERWNKARDLATSPNPEDQKRWNEMLEDLGLNRQMIKPSAAGSVDDNFRQMRDSGNRTRPPENLRKQYEAFRRAFEKSGK